MTDFIIYLLEQPVVIQGSLIALAVIALSQLINILKG